MAWYEASRLSSGQTVWTCSKAIRPEIDHIKIFRLISGDDETKFVCHVSTPERDKFYSARLGLTTEGFNAICHDEPYQDWKITAVTIENSSLTIRHESVNEQAIKWLDGNKLVCGMLTERAFSEKIPLESFVKDDDSLNLEICAYDKHNQPLCSHVASIAPFFISIATHDGTTEEFQRQYVPRTNS